MNRRDTIVVAVLINAGVLIVLFTSALKSKSADDQIAVVAPPSIVHEVAIQPEKQVAMRDEVDQVINQLNTPPVEPKISTTPITDFTADLNAFAAAEPQKEPSSPPPAPAQKEFVEVKVKKGDFLAKIARRHHSSVETIMKVNKLSSTNLKIGQVLKIPAAVAHSAPAPAEVREVAASDEAKYYVVRRGDNPWTIAVKNKIKVDELLRLNDLDAEKAKHLKPGDKLRVH